MLCSFHKNGPEIEFSEIAKIWLDKFRKMKYNNSRKSRHATVAQLVEQLIRNQQVAGSSPASSSKIGKPCRRLADFSMFRNGKSGLHFSPDSCKLAI